jgi:hypothetical protein
LVLLVMKTLDASGVAWALKRFREPAPHGEPTL